MPNEPAAAPDSLPSQDRKVRKAWCDRCGNLPAESVRPKIIGLAQGDLIYSLPCSQPGCDGDVRLKGFELRMLARGALVAEIPEDLKVVRDVQKAAMNIVNGEGENKADPADRVAAGRLALAASKENLKMAGLLVDAPTLIQQVNQQFNFDPGDVIDEELEDLFNGKDAFVIDVEKEPPPAPTKPTDIHPAGDEAGYC